MDKKNTTSSYRGVILSLEYELETESNVGLVLLAYQLSQPISLLPSLLPPLSTPTILPLLYTMSHYNINLHAIIRQQQEQLVAMQAQIQALKEREVRGVAAISTEVAKLQVFDRTSLQISDFVMAYRLYIRMKMRGVVVEEQIQ